MPVILDGNNLLHRLPPGLPRREEVRSQALEAVRRQTVTLIVVFDGPPPEGSPEVEYLGRVTIRYSGKEVADDHILSLLPAGGAREWVVVSDDRELRERARSRGARVRSLDEWAGRRRAPRRPRSEPILSSREIAEWEIFFSQERNQGDD